MLICPPGNALLYQWNCDPGPIGIEINQFQCVCGNEVKAIKLPDNHTGFRLIRGCIKILSVLPLNMLFAIAPQGAIGVLPIIRYGSHSLLGSCGRKTRSKHQNLLIYCTETHTRLYVYRAYPYLKRREVSIQLAVISGFHIATMVLVEVWKAIVHKNITLGMNKVYLVLELYTTHIHTHAFKGIVKWKIWPMLLLQCKRFLVDFKVERVTVFV